MEDIPVLLYNMSPFSSPSNLQNAARCVTICARTVASRSVSLGLGKPHFVTLTMARTHCGIPNSFPLFGERSLIQIPSFKGSGSSCKYSHGNSATCSLLIRRTGEIPKLFPESPDLAAESLRHGPPAIKSHLVFDFKNQPRDGI
jgi:hypothetical protein